MNGSRFWGSKRHWTKNFIPLGLLGLFLGVAVMFAFEHRDQIRQTSIVSLWKLMGVVAVFYSNIATRSLFTKYVLKAFGIRIPFSEAMAIGCATTMANLLLPFRTGAGLQAAYLARNYQFPIPEFVSAMAAFYFASIFVSAGFGFFASLVLIIGGTQIPMVVVGFLGILTVIPVMVVAVPRLAFLGIFGRINLVARFIDGWETIRGRRLTVSMTLLISFASTLIAATGIYWGFGAFGFGLGGMQSLFLVSSQMLGGLIGLTPGAAGFQEGIGILFSSHLGIGLAEALVVFSVLRIIRVVASVVLGLPSLWALSRKPLS